MFTEWVQMPLHVGVPPETAAAGLRGPQSVHGLFLGVSSPLVVVVVIVVVGCDYGCGLNDDCVCLS